MGIAEILKLRQNANGLNKLMNMHVITLDKDGGATVEVELTDELLKHIIADLPFVCGDEVAVLVNGLGATPLEEQYVMNRRIEQVLADKGISVFHTYVGEYATSMEMAGVSISLFRLDDELKSLLRAPADTPFFKQFEY